MAVRPHEALDAEVLRLSKADRTPLLDRLIDGIDEDATAEAAGDAIAEQREQQLRANNTAALPLAEVMARLEARFPG